MSSQPFMFMVIHPLTIILNSNHTTRMSILLDSNSDAKHTILHESRNKFKQDSISRVFILGGQELEDHGTLSSSIKEVFVSMGEDYIPPPPETRIIANLAVIHAKAIEQLESVTKLPGVRMAVGFPDLHPGTQFPIGYAVAVDDVYPALIGSDLGCGVAVYALTPPLKNRPLAHLERTSELADLLRGLDGPWDGDVHDWLELHGIRRHSPFDKSSLGTIGGGNHFAEICIGKAIFDGGIASDAGLLKDALYLIVHTGSRGLGAIIQEEYTANKSNPILPTHSALLDSYLEEHDYAVRWAAANRDLVAHRIMMCLFENTDDPVELTKIIDVVHNSVTKESVEIHKEASEVWIHRKGAIPTDKGIVPCPGSRGDCTWILAPSGDGNYNLRSLAHGAGRTRPRQDLHTDAPSKVFLTVTKYGSAIVCTDNDLLIEERPDAYKPIDDVVSDMVEMGICACVALLAPVVTYKIREAGERRT